MAESAADSIRNCFVVITTIRNTHTHTCTHKHMYTGLAMADRGWLTLQFWERREKMMPEKTDRPCLNMVLGVWWV